MRISSWRILWAAAACGAGLLSGRGAGAQSLGGSGSAPSVAPSPAIQAMAVAPLFGPQVPNAAADQAASLSGVPTPNNIFNNPMAAPLLYPSMAGPLWAQGQAAASAGTSTGTTTGTSSSTSSSTSSGTSAGRSAGMHQGMAMNQLAMFMLLSNQQNGGVGSGRISGARGTRRQAGSPGSQAAADGRARSLSRPGGLASRYFNRTASHPAYPQQHFNRRPSYFP